MNNVIRVQVAGEAIDFEVNSYARQSDGSVWIRAKDTVLLVTANAARSARESQDFIPLTMEYVERSQATGKIPGGYFKREGRPSEKAILTSRLMDRPIRPLIADGWFYETQVIATLFSSDNVVFPDVLAVTGASFALCASNIPLTKPIGCVRIGKIKGQLKVNPSMAEIKESDLDLIVAATDEAICMVEGGANELSEAEMLDALMLGFESAQPLVQAQKQLLSQLGITKRPGLPTLITKELQHEVEGLVTASVEKSLTIDDKIERYRLHYQAVDQAKSKLKESGKYNDAQVGMTGEIAEEVKKRLIRQTVKKGGKRIGGRSTTEVRPIDCKVGLLPRTHGSAMFTRGDTRALVVATLGTGDDEQRIDALEGEITKRFMLHYNFPPYSVGEVKRMLSPGRREIGHGALAERSIERMLPSHDAFPYTLRVVSDILESNGSSSMATICGGALALMDAGVPIKSPVAGVAMGLFHEDDRFFVLTDILGDEDHIGDMDFKVAGTRKGITGLQMDIKISGVTRAILSQAMDQAREARFFVLDKMALALEAPRSEINPNAPRIHLMMVNPAKLKDIIGPGGKMIRSIIAETGAKIDVEDSGKVIVASANLEMLDKAVKKIESICEEPEIGKIYKGVVRRIADFGAFVEILPGTDGLVHVSQLDTSRVENVRDFIKEGDEIEVKIIAIDQDNKIRLSRKAVLTGSDGSDDLPPPRRDRGGSEHRRGGRPQHGRR